MRLKYVMTDRGPIFFPETFNHVEFLGYHPTSAGTFSVGIGKDEKYGGQKLVASCYGESVSLKMRSDPKDEEMIQRMIDFS